MRRKKIWDILYPSVFFYLVMIAASVVGIIAAGKITGRFDEDASGLLNQVRGLPLMVSLGAFIFTFLMLYRTYKKDDLRFGSDRLLPSPGVLILSALLVTSVGFLWSALIDACGISRLFPYYDQSVASAFEDQNIYLLIASTVIAGPFAEELVFRGMTYRRARSAFGRGWGIAISAFLFGLYHANMVQFIYAFGLGILLAVLYDRSRCLLLAVTCHMCANLWAIYVTGIQNAAAERGRAYLLYLIHGAVAILAAFLLFKKKQCNAG